MVYAGNPEKSAEALLLAAKSAQEDAGRAEAAAKWYLGLGVLLGVLHAIGRGWIANTCLERRFQAWRSNRVLVSGWSWKRVGVATLVQTLFAILIVDCLTLPDAPQILLEFTTDRLVRQHVALYVEAAFHWLTYNAEFIFDPIKLTITRIQTLLQTVLLATPWPIVMSVILAAAWRSAGPRVAQHVAQGMVVQSI